MRDRFVLLVQYRFSAFTTSCQFQYCPQFLAMTLRPVETVSNLLRDKEQAGKHSLSPDTGRMLFEKYIGVAERRHG